MIPLYYYPSRYFFSSFWKEVEKFYLLVCWIGWTYEHFNWHGVGTIEISWPCSNTYWRAEPYETSVGLWYLRVVVQDWLRYSEWMIDSDTLYYALLVRINQLSLSSVRWISFRMIEVFSVERHYFDCWIHQFNLILCSGKVRTWLVWCNGFF